MKLKKTLTILIAVLFSLVIMFSFAGIFSVKKVNATYAVSDDANVSELQEKFDKFLNKNILFLNVEEVCKALDDFHYMEIVSVKKEFPNVIEVEVVERREVYYLDYGTNYLVTTADGFILRSISKSSVIENNRDKIVLTLDGVSILDATIGKVLRTDDDRLLSTVFEMAKSVNLTDCIKNIKVFSPGTEMSDVIFGTYTGVDIVVEKAEISGVDKVIEGFKAYDEEASDYEKMFKTIIVFRDNQGAIQVDWTDKK